MTMAQFAFRIHFRLGLTLLALWASTNRAQLHFFNPGTLQFSPECNSALAAELDCTVLETGGFMYTREAELTADILDQMCTEKCKAFLKVYREAVEAACTHDKYDATKHDTGEGNPGVYKPIVLPDYYITNYNQRCLTDSNGEYCALKLQEAETVDHCDECNLWTFREKLDNGFFANDDLLDNYAHRISSCRVTTIPPPMPSSVLLSSTPAPTARKRPCAGRKVPIQPGDTCDSFTLRHNVSTYRLLIDNGLQSGCVDFPTRGLLCVIGSCQTHRVTESDTCPGLASKYGITITQFRTWNQVLNARCSIMGILVGHMVCVGYPGRGTPAKAVPPPSNLAPDVNTKSGKYYQVKEGDYCAVIAMENFDCTNLRPGYSYCVSPIGNIETYPGYAADLPTATLKPWTSLPTQTTLPLAKGTRKDCKVLVNCTLANNTRYCVSLWDPALEEADDDDDDWMPGYEGVPENAAPESTEDCYDWYSTEEGDTCDSMLQCGNIALDAFYAWNPSVKYDCSNLTLNTSYCVSGDDFEDTVYPWPLGTSTIPAPPITASTSSVDTVELPALLIQP
ncbi:hypothetical protein BJX66DRAFT_327064 [Aspergillus keveii]|uniref:LysM domain-containing protein n=1 Tax=Aspergillus keveii TaxID=714993 RepID=A0ABR4FYZ3_9EURO